MERAKGFEKEGQTLSAIETAVRLPANLDAGVHRGIGVVHVHDFAQFSRSSVCIRTEFSGSCVGSMRWYKGVASAIGSFREATCRSF